jgi:hypothetical protein
MNSKPEWLPDLISVDGNWEEVLKKLYEIFRIDFIIGKPKLEDKPVFWDKNKKRDNEYENGFWHLIEKKYPGSDERRFDPRRSERLPWCVPVISHYNDVLIKYWEYSECGNKINIYLWLEDFDYVIIFQKRKFKIGVVAFLLTAFYVDGNSKKRNLNKKFLGRVL